MATTHTEYSPNTITTAPASGRVLDLASLTLLIIGGVNWGLVGLFDLDLVASLFGDGTMMARVVYVLVGLAALYGIVTATRVAKKG
jgi:uncharacterized membrane protein YuzA (DUF378 family)